MSDAMPPVLTPDEEPQEEKAVAIEKSLNKFSKVFSNMSQQMIQKTQQTGSSIAESVINNGLGPVSAALKPFESFFGFNTGKGIAGLFGKVGTGLFGTGEEYKGPINENKIRKIDPGAIYLSTSFKEALEESNQDGNFLSRFLRLLGGGGLVAAGLGFLLSGLTDDGPLKGLKKVVGRFLHELGQKFVRRILRPFRGFLDDLIKPIKGLLDDVWKRFKGLLDNILKPFKSMFDSILKPFKSLFDSALKLGKSLLDTILKPFKKLAKGILKPFKFLLDKILKPISGLFDSLLKPFKSLVDNIARSAGKTLGKSALGGGIKKLFAPVLKFVKGKAGKLLKGMKFIPGIGSIFSFGFAISRFKQGDITGGILELMAGFADLVPGVGTAISWGLDIFLAARDMGAFEDGGLIKANLKDVFAGIWQWVKRKGKALFGIIGSVMNTLFTGAIEWVGDKISGALELGRWAVDVSSNWMSGIFDMVMNWVRNKLIGLQDTMSNVNDFLDEKVFGPLGNIVLNIWGGARDAIGNFQDWAEEKVITPLGEFFINVWSGVTEKWNTMTSWIDEHIIEPVKRIFSWMGDIFARARLDLAETLTVGGGNKEQFRENRQALIDRGYSERDILSAIRESGGAGGISDFLRRISVGDFAYGMDEMGYETVNDAIIKTDGSIIHTNPNDTLIATQNPVARSTESNATSLNQSISQTFQNMGNELANKLDQLSQIMAQSGNNGGGVVQQNNTYSSRFSPSAVMNDMSAEAF